MAWTGHRVALLHQLSKEGLSYKEIALRLGGVSRSAVIGKAYRLGISVDPRVAIINHARAVRRGVFGPPKQKAAPKPKPKPKPKPAPRAMKALTRQPYFKPKPKPKPKPPPLRVQSTDPAALVADAILARACAAQRRRDSWRHEYGMRWGR